MRKYTGVMQYFHNFEHDPEGLNHCHSEGQHPYTIKHVDGKHVISNPVAIGHGRGGKQQGFRFTERLAGGYDMASGEKINIKRGGNNMGVFDSAIATTAAVIPLAITAGIAKGFMPGNRKAAVPRREKGSRPRMTYGVFLPGGGRGGKWDRTNSLKVAKAAVDKYGGTIYAMPYSAGNQTYDAPTFKMTATKLDYKPKREKAAPKLKTAETKTASKKAQVFLVPGSETGSGKHIVRYAADGNLNKGKAKSFPATDKGWQQAEGFAHRKGKELNAKTLIHAYRLNPTYNTNYPQKGKVVFKSKTATITEADDKSRSRSRVGKGRKAKTDNRDLGAGVRQGRGGRHIGLS